MTHMPNAEPSPPPYATDQAIPDSAGGWTNLAITGVAIELVSIAVSLLLWAVTWSISVLFVVSVVPPVVLGFCRKSNSAAAASVVLCLYVITIAVLLAGSYVW